MGEYIKMKKSTIIAIILCLFIEMPIWFYLMYWLLSQSNPDRLIWFLFWVYVPVIIFNNIAVKIAGEEK
jgi:hypothetical protein